MEVELSLYWSELTHLFNLPDDVRRYAFIQFYAPLIQANKEFRLIKQCYLFCSNPININDRIIPFIDFLGNASILLDTRVIDDRLDLYVSLIELFIPNRLGHDAIDVILAKALECNNLHAFEVAYQRRKELKQHPLFHNIAETVKRRWSESINPFIRRIVQQVQVNPTIFNTFPIAFQERMVLSCLELEDCDSIAIFLSMMDDIENMKYTIIKENSHASLLKILQNKFKKSNL